MVMNLPDWIKPTIWGSVGGAIAAIAIGFSWAGWVTQGTAGQMERASAEAAVVQVFAPLCVAKAEQQPEMLVTLKEENTWRRHDFVVKAGWVDNVSDEYRDEVAKVCASTLVEGMATG
jgi:membrane-bound lytic murein transglycosylase B